MPTEYQWLRQWENAVRIDELSRYRGRRGYSLRFLLRALGEAARKTGARRIEFGVRSLAVATGLDHGTVARLLHQLREEDSPFIVLVRSNYALDADQYELVIPEADNDRAHRLRWTAGLTHALRPAFRELGHMPALVYEAIEHSASALGSAELIDRTQISRSGVHAALETLAAFNLIRQHRGLWSVNTGTSLIELAEQLGCIAEVQQQKTRYAVERIVWRTLVMSNRWLVSQLTSQNEAWPPWPEPPPDDAATLFDLLEYAS